MRASTIHVDPVVTVIDAASSWAWHEVSDLADVWMSRLIFHPLHWYAPVIELYGVSRDLAWSLTGLLVIVVALRSMWPQLIWFRSRLSVPLFLERLVVATLLAWSGIWIVKASLTINNAIVGWLIQNSTRWNPTQASGGVLSPVVVLIVSLGMLLLLLYLALFYAIRAIELFILTAAIPWFLLWWATKDDDMVLSNLAREIGVVIFIQSFHAAAFWLAVRMMSQGHWGFMRSFLELALLWYMSKLPTQLRRLVGLGQGGNRLWR